MTWESERTQLWPSQEGQKEQKNYEHTPTVSHL